MGMSLLIHVGMKLIHVSKWGPGHMSETTDGSLAKTTSRKKWIKVPGGMFIHDPAVCGDQNFKGLTSLLMILQWHS